MIWAAAGSVLVFGGFGDYDVMNDLWILQFGEPAAPRPAGGAAAGAAGTTEDDWQDLLEIDAGTARWVRPDVEGEPPSARSFHSVTMVRPDPRTF